MSKARFAILIILGIVLAVLCHVAVKGFAHLVPSSPQITTANAWYALLYPFLAALSRVAPAFVVGWLARQSGFILGALVGLFSSFAIAMLFEVAWQNVSLSSVTWLFCLNFIMWALPSVIFSSLAGAAGELAVSRLPSNNSFQRTPNR